MISEQAYCIVSFLVTLVYFSDSQIFGGYSYERPHTYFPENINVRPLIDAENISTHFNQDFGGYIYERPHNYFIEDGYQKPVVDTENVSTHFKQEFGGYTYEKPYNYFEDGIRRPVIDTANVSTHTKESDDTTLSSKQLAASNCAAWYRSAEFRLQSPRFPAQYPAGILCLYIVEAVSPNVCFLEVNFLTFDLGDCSSGHFVVIAGQKICGNVYGLQTFRFSPPTSLIQFRTTTVASGRGFDILIRQKQCPSTAPPHQACSGIFSSNNFILQSPGFPSPYPANIRCQYNIRATQSSFPQRSLCQAEFQFQKLNIENSGGCTKDRLEIGDQDVICGYLTGVRIYQFVGELRVRFISDSSINAEGFRINVIQRGCTPLNLSPGSTFPSQPPTVLPPQPPSIVPPIGIFPPVWPQPPTGPLPQPPSVFPPQPPQIFPPQPPSVIPPQPPQIFPPQPPSVIPPQPPQIFPPQPPQPPQIFPPQPPSVIPPQPPQVFPPQPPILPPTFPPTIYPPTLPSIPSSLPLCCGKVYQGIVSLIASPGFPYGNSNEDIDCLYEIRPYNSEICRLKIQFKLFWIGQEDEYGRCSGGFLEIDGRQYCDCKSGLTVTSLFENQWNGRRKLFRYRKNMNSRYSGGFLIQISQERCGGWSSWSRSDDGKFVNNDMNNQQQPYFYDIPFNYSFTDGNRSVNSVDVGLKRFNFENQDKKYFNYTPKIYQIPDSISHSLEGNKSIYFTNEVNNRIPKIHGYNISFQNYSNDKQNESKTNEQKTHFNNKINDHNEVHRKNVLCRLNTSTEKSIKLASTKMKEDLMNNCSTIQNEQNYENPVIFETNPIYIEQNISEITIREDVSRKGRVSQSQINNAYTKVDSISDTDTNHFSAGRDSLIHNVHNVYQEIFTPERMILPPNDENIFRADMDKETSVLLNSSYKNRYDDEKDTQSFINNHYSENFSGNQDKQGGNYRINHEINTDSGSQNAENSFITIPNKYNQNSSSQFQSDTSITASGNDCMLDIPDFIQEDANDQTSGSENNLRGCNKTSDTSTNIKSRERRHFVLQQSPSKLYHPASQQMFGVTSERLLSLSGISCRIFGFTQWLLQVKQYFLNNLPQLICPVRPPSGSSCQNFYQPTGSLQSPGYPDAYPNNINYCYRLFSLPGYCQVQISMVDFSLENSANCVKDYLLIAGQWRYCGNSLASTGTIWDLSSVQYLELRFVSDSYNSGRGFRAFYNYIPCNRRMETIPEPPSDCGQVAREQYFTLNRNGYQRQNSCTYRIIKKNEEICTLQLTFSTFNLVCGQEYLQIGSKFYCGSLSGQKVEADFDNQEMKIVYQRMSQAAQGSFTIQGQQMADCDILSEVPLVARISNTSAQCDIQLSDARGFVVSPKLQLSSPESYACGYNIQPQEGMCSVKLEFGEFLLPSPTDDCTSAYIELERKKFCNSQLEQKTAVLAFHGGAVRIPLYIKEVPETSRWDFTYTQLPCRNSAQ